MKYAEVCRAHDESQGNLRTMLITIGRWGLVVEGKKREGRENNYSSAIATHFYFYDVV